jgi:hypothetical protein
MPPQGRLGDKSPRRWTRLPSYRACRRCAGDRQGTMRRDFMWFGGWFNKLMESYNANSSRADGYIFTGRNNQI